MDVGTVVKTQDCRVGVVARREPQYGGAALLEVHVLVEMDASRMAAEMGLERLSKPVVVLAMEPISVSEDQCTALLDHAFEALPPVAQDVLGRYADAFRAAPTDGPCACGECHT